MRFPAGEACTCENGPSFLVWKPEPAAWADFGLRDVHVKTNGCFCSLSVHHDCHPPLHVCISCRSQRKHTRHIASVRYMLNIESNRRFRRVCVNTGRAHMRIKGACLGRSRACFLDRRFRHVCPFLVCMWPRTPLIIRTVDQKRRDKSAVDVASLGGRRWYMDDCATGSFCSSCAIPPRVAGGLWSDGVGCDACCYPFGVLCRGCG